MPATRWPLREVVSRLATQYGKPAPPPSREPFALVLWECCAYLVDDARRARVYARLLEETGGDPHRIAALKPIALARLIAEGGMQPAMRAAKLQQAADLALEVGPRELGALCRRDPAQARSILKRFPGIGEPGADKILMIVGGLESLAPESNGLRVLLRLGFGKPDARYQRTYRSVSEAIAPELPATAARRVAAHQLLRLHGKALCKNGTPLCAPCGLAARCPSAR